MELALEEVLHRLALGLSRDASWRQEPAAEGRVRERANAERFSALQRVLYDEFSRGEAALGSASEARAPERVPSRQEKRAFLAAMEAANQGREHWELNWRVSWAGRDGSLVATRSNRARMFLPGEYIREGLLNKAVRPGERLRVLQRKGHEDPEGYFYFVFGEYPPEHEMRMTRLYFSIRQDGALPLIESVSRIFNRHRVPFELKCLKDPELYARGDAAVMYLDQRYFHVGCELLTEVFPAFRASLKPSTPLFTRELHPGVGFAENPPTGESYGAHRVRLIARGFMKALVEGARPERWPDHALASLKEEGLDPERLYLNPGSHYPYVWPDFQRARVHPVSAPLPTARGSGRPEFLEAAFEVGAGLCRDAFWDGERCNWMGALADPADPSRTIHGSLGPDYYQGTSGVGLFLAQLYRVTGEPLVRKGARGALTQALSALSQLECRPESFHNGAVGAVYAAVAGGELLGDEQLISRGLEHLRSLELPVPGAMATDVISGAAGAIPALCWLQARYPSERFEEWLRRLGQHLSLTAVQESPGFAWKTVERASRPLTGFSHGAAGIATALVELYVRTREARLLELARGAVDYEDHWLRSEEGNWPDFRLPEDDTEPEQLGCAMAWCHGAPGIGLARARMDSLLGEPRFRTGMSTALATTSRELEAALREGDEDLSLCHGLGGLIELLLVSGGGQESPEALALAERAALHGLEVYRTRGGAWPCGPDEQSQTLGMMQGLAGIGMLYLRVHAPQAVPSPLMVLPPVP